MPGTTDVEVVVVLVSEVLSLASDVVAWALVAGARLTVEVIGANVVDCKVVEVVVVSVVNVQVLDVLVIDVEVNVFVMTGQFTPVHVHRGEEA